MKTLIVRKRIKEAKINVKAKSGAFWHQFEMTQLPSRVSVRSISSFGYFRYTQ